MTKRIVYAIALSATALAIGCGGDDDDGGVNNNADRYEGTDAEVAQVVDDLGSAARDGDGAQICDEIFTAEWTDRIEEQSGQSCETEVAQNLPEDEYELTIDSLEVQDDTATVGVTDQNDNSSVLYFENTGSAWQVTRIASGD